MWPLSLTFPIGHTKFLAREVSIIPWRDDCSAQPALLTMNSVPCVNCSLLINKPVFLVCVCCSDCSICCPRLALTFVCRGFNGMTHIILPRGSSWQARRLKVGSQMKLLPIFIMWKPQSQSQCTPGRQLCLTP